MPSVTTAISVERFQEWLSRTPLRQLYANLFALRRANSFWLGKVSEERIQDLFEQHPWLLEFIDSAIVTERLKSIGLFQPFTIDGVDGSSNPRLTKIFGVSLSDFMPENQSTVEGIIQFITSSQIPLLEKAEAWLFAVANAIETPGDLEAVVYLASRAKENVHPDVVEEEWYETICWQIERSDSVLRPISDTIKELAAKRVITKKQAADALRSRHGELLLPATHTDHEQLFIGSTLLRSCLS